MTFGATTPMLCDEYPEYDILASNPAAASSATMHVHVDDADAAIAGAFGAGATLVMPARDQFCGERSSVIRDPFGQRWNIGHSIEQVSKEEMQRRYDKFVEPC